MDRSPQEAANLTHAQEFLAVLTKERDVVAQDLRARRVKLDPDRRGSTSQQGLYTGIGEVEAELVYLDRLIARLELEHGCSGP